jgi:DNA-binding MurR/RpiR family transcriptional regulator
MSVNLDTAAWPEYMTIAEVAAVLRLSKMTVYRMVHRGEFNYREADTVVAGAIRAGRSFRVSSVALGAYLRGSAVSA